MATDHDFNTPPWVIALVRQLDMNGVIGLDPCSNPYSMVGAAHTYDVQSNGLAHPWRGHGLVYVNPPHSTSPHNIEPWMEKARAEFLDDPPERESNPTRDQLCMLIPCKTDTRWFHHHVTRFSARCFLAGRPKYWQRGTERPGPGKFASLIVYYGQSTGLFYKIFGQYGWIV